MVTVGGKRYCDVPERIERMIVWLLEHAMQIGQADKLKVTFCLAGRTVQAEMSESFRVE